MSRDMSVSCLIMAVPSQAGLGTVSPGASWLRPGETAAAAMVVILSPS